MMNKQSVICWSSPADRRAAAVLLRQCGIEVLFLRKKPRFLLCLDRSIPLFIETDSADAVGEALLAAERAGFQGAVTAPFPGGAFMIAFFGKRQGSAVITTALAALPGWEQEGPLFLGALALYGTGLTRSVLAGADRIRKKRKRYNDKN